MSNNPSYHFHGCRLAGVQVRSIDKDHALHICMDTDLGLVDFIYRFTSLADLKDACSRISEIFTANSQMQKMC